MTNLLKDGGTSLRLCSAFTVFIFHLISHRNRRPRREIDVTSSSERSRSIGSCRNCDRGVFVSDEETRPSRWGLLSNSVNCLSAGEVIQAAPVGYQQHRDHT